MFFNNWLDIVTLILKLLSLIIVVKELVIKLLTQVTVNLVLCDMLVNYINYFIPFNLNIIISVYYVNFYCLNYSLIIFYFRYLLALTN